MKLYLTMFFCFIFSILFIVFTLFMTLEPIYSQQIKKDQLSKIQKVCKKKYLRQRKIYRPMRSILIAQEEIAKLLKKSPIVFNLNGFSLELEKTVEIQMLRKVGMLLNNLKEEAILRISTYTDSVGSDQDNLTLSQKRADILKAYFLKRTNLLLITAIGYGEALPLTSRRIELNLIKVKE